METFPRQSLPVKRPALVQPSDSVNLKYSEFDQGEATLAGVDAILAIRLKLLHGANYNDPAYYAPRGYGQVMHSGLGLISRHF